jgi:vesicle-fusing ATPase
LLYGPPGTGKTLIARQLAKSLHCHEPKIVSGPEIFDKYVGGSEEKVRLLFADAEKDEKMLGEESELHIIIFDEFEAICRARGSIQSSTGVNDSVVNQLLAKMDGVDRLNNILIIGMTNRLDMIDEAILRPGRMELKVEIGLPSEEGRLQIVKIHTKKMRENNILESNVNLEYIAKVTKNYTGAEIESLVTRASTFALNRGVDVKNLNAKLNFNQKISMKDFESSLEEVRPQFGSDDYAIGSNIQLGIVNYGEKFDKLYKRMTSLVDQIKNSNTNSLLSIMLEGDSECGKTALACKIALESEFPYIKMVTPETLVSKSVKTYLT